MELGNVCDFASMDLARDSDVGILFSKSGFDPLGLFVKATGKSCLQ